MFNENYNKTNKVSEGIKMKSVMEDKSPRGFIGEVFDTAINPVTGERTPLHHGFNLVVDSCSKLIAGLIKGDVQGVQYLAVGSGSSSWDNENLPDPTLDETKLVNETFRKVVEASDIVYITEDNKVSEEITNRLQITITFNENEANGELRELGFFGGNATETKDSGLMLNHKIHASIYKTSGMILERVIRFTF